MIAGHYNFNTESYKKLIEELEKREDIKEFESKKRTKKKIKIEKMKEREKEKKQKEEEEKLEKESEKISKLQREQEAKDMETFTILPNVLTKKYY